MAFNRDHMLGREVEEIAMMKVLGQVQNSQRAKRANTTSSNDSNDEELFL